MLGEFLASLRRSRVSVARVIELVPEESHDGLLASDPLHLRRALEDPPLVTRPVDDGLNTLSIEGLTYRHPETGRGIDNVTLSMPRGSFTVVTGRIGAGKTTLLETLLGMLPFVVCEVESGY